MSSDISISVKNLSKRYRKNQAIKNVSFDINNGEIVGLLGPNGAGKSTILKILGGLTIADEGQAYVAGLPVSENGSAIKRKIGFMQENNPLPVDLRVREYLKLRAELKEIPKDKIASEVRRVMDLCDLFRTSRRKIIRTLSKGFKQRVGIADALIGSPHIIILDEPTIGLDPHQIQGMRKLIDALRLEHTVLITSHILSEIEKNCDKVIIINHGRVVASGSKQKLAEEFVTKNDLIIKIKGSPISFKKALEISNKTFVINSEKKSSIEIHNFTLSNESLINSTYYIDIINNLKDCELLGVHEIKPDLEAIFIAATKRSWDEIHNYRRNRHSLKIKP